MLFRREDSDCECWENSLVAPRRLCLSPASRFEGHTHAYLSESAALRMLIIFIGDHKLVLSEITKRKEEGKLSVNREKHESNKKRESLNSQNKVQAFVRPPLRLQYRNGKCFDIARAPSRANDLNWSFACAEIGKQIIRRTNFSTFWFRELIATLIVS